MIEFQNVEVSCYGDKEWPRTRILNLQIENGEIIGLIGP